MNEVATITANPLKTKHPILLRSMPHPFASPHIPIKSPISFLLPQILLYPHKRIIQSEDRLHSCYLPSSLVSAQKLVILPATK